MDEIVSTTGAEIDTVTADVGYTYAKVYGGVERCDIDPLIPVAVREIPWRAKTLHGLRRAVRHGLANMKVQAYLAVVAINLSG